VPAGTPAEVKTYGRGVGYPWKFGDKFGSLADAKGRCEAGEKDTGCE